jgi:hypothetical protein
MPVRSRSPAPVLQRDAARRVVVHLMKQLKAVQSIGAETPESPVGERLKSPGSDAPSPRSGCGPVTHFRRRHASSAPFQHDVSCQTMTADCRLPFQNRKAQPLTSDPASLLDTQPPPGILVAGHGSPGTSAQAQVTVDVDQVRDVFFRPRAKQERRPLTARRRMQRNSHTRPSSIPAAAGASAATAATSVRSRDSAGPR